MDDDFDFAYDEAPAKTGGGKTAVPEGTHDFRIHAVTLTDEKILIELHHDDPGYFYVRCDPPRTATTAWRRTIGSLAKALGMTPPQVRDQIAAGDLVGRRVGARIWHKTSNAGATFANVGEFHPPKASVETATARPMVERAVAMPSSRSQVRRTATQKADHAAAMPDDDIPF